MNAPAQSPFLTAALEHAAEGCRVFSIIPGQKSPPRFKGWQQSATCDAEKIRAHWSAHPDDNIGIACGDGVLGLDEDGEAGARSLAALEAMHGKLPETCKVRTPSGGAHYYFTGPDVANSASKIAPGIDVRSASGYLVAPGSRTAAGAYTVEHAADFAPAPQWLIDLCNKPGEKMNKCEPVADAPADAVERARDWLSRHAPAVEGAGGDAHTYETAAKLRDLGVSQAQCVELMAGEWNSRCAPPWTVAELETKARNAFAYAQDAPGKLAVSAADFPVEQSEQPQQSPAAKPEARSGAFPRVKRLSEITIHSGNGNFVDGLCNMSETFQAIGAPGGRKSQVIGWLAYCVATGQRWFNRETASGSVLYIAAERESEQAKRFTVWALADSRDPDALPLRIMGPGSTLMRLDFAAYVAEQAAALNAETGQPCRLIVIDTTMASLPGENLNDTPTATQFGQSLRVIAGKVPSAAVCAVHHTPKSGAATGMGSQGFDAAFEATLLIEATDAGGSVKQIKGNTTRDWIADMEWAGDPLQVERGGETFMAWRPKLAPAGRTFRSPVDKLKGNARRAWDELCRLHPDNAPILDSEWKAHCAEFLGDRKSAWTDARKQIEDLRLILRAGDPDARGGAILWRRAMVG